VALPLAGGTLDRLGERRGDAAWLEEARADPRAVGVDGRTGEVGPLAGRATLALLGAEDDGTPVFLVAGEDDPAAPRVDLRGVVMGERDPARQGLLAYAAHLAHFHRVHRFCGSCGQPSEAFDAGHGRRCPDGHEVHPRTDPVAIMLVVDGTERCLMGRQRAWPPGRFSALAGFVEPGESLEAAVAREVLEEAGVRTGEVRYVASQPWPFPASLMLGFEAELAGDDAVAPLDAELETVRWFSREEVAEAARDDVGWEADGDTTRLLLPPKLAIARFLVDGWLGRGGVPS
jgi:NAD+ diphosphatase